MKSPQLRSGLSETFAGGTPAVKMRPAATRPFSIRLSQTERQQLEREAGSQALGTYAKARLLNQTTPRRPNRSAAEAAMLGKILGMMGRLQLASSLSDLAVAAKTGAIAMTPELERDVQAVIRDVREIRDLLMRALGFKPEPRA